MSGEITSLYSKEAFQNFFDIAYASQHGVHNCADEGFNGLLKEEARIIQETGKHVYVLQDKQVEELGSKMLAMGEKHGWKLLNGKVGAGASKLESLESLENLVYSKK